MSQATFTGLKIRSRAAASASTSSSTSRELESASRPLVDRIGTSLRAEVESQGLATHSDSFPARDAIPSQSHQRPHPNHSPPPRGIIAESRQRDSGKERQSSTTLRRDDRDLDDTFPRNGKDPQTHSRRDADRRRNRLNEEEREKKRSNGNHRRHERSHSCNSGSDLERKTRRTARSRSRERHSRRTRRPSHSHYSRDRHRAHPSDSESYDSETDSSEHRRQRYGKVRHRERKDKRRDRREKSPEKKSSREKLKPTAASTDSWGKFGVISEADMNSKGSEFRAWLIEERRLNPDTLHRDKTKKEFAIFVEDYNTATLSHEKYYDIGKYQARMNLIKFGATLAPEEDGGSYSLAADMKAHKATVDRRYEKPTATLSREEIMELRKIEAERIEIGQRRLLGLEIPKYYGVRTEEVDRATLFNDEPMPHGFQS